jgi:hypothetical protein
MVPAWLIEQRPSGHAVHAYICLALRGTFHPGSGTYEECRPSIATLASDMGVGESTARRAADELVRLGAVTRTVRYDPKGAQLPSMYRVVFGSVVRPRSVTETGVGPLSQVTDNPEPFNPEPKHPEKKTPRSAQGELVAVGDPLSAASSRGSEAEDRICHHLADRIAANGSRRPTVGDRWRNSARLMMTRDERTEEQIHAAIDWCQDDEFWRVNILSVPKLREKFDQLRLAADRERQVRSVISRAIRPQHEPGYWDRHMAWAREREAAQV